MGQKVRHLFPVTPDENVHFTGVICRIYVPKIKYFCDRLTQNHTEETEKKDYERECN